MRNPPVRQIVFISAFLNDNPKELNLDRHESLKLVVKDNLGMNFTEVDGVYEGRSQKSLMVIISSQAELTKLVDIGDFYNQDCVLYRDTNRQAWLMGYDHKKDGVKIEWHLGEFGEITKEQADKLDDYTYMPSTKTYWGVIK